MSPRWPAQWKRSLAHQPKIAGNTGARGRWRNGPGETPPLPTSNRSRPCQLSCGGSLRLSSPAAAAARPVLYRDPIAVLDPRPARFHRQLGVAIAGASLNRYFRQQLVSHTILNKEGVEPETMRSD